MTHPLRSLLVATAALGLAAPAMAQSTSPSGPSGPCCVQPPAATTLSLSASADAKVAPDMATISAGVLTSARTAKDALTANSERMNAVFAAIRAAGVAERDVQTSRITVSPQYVYETGRKPRITGYQAANTVTIKLRRLEAVGEVLDALVQQGANDINGPVFGLEDPDAALDAARTEAMQKAIKRAELYARAAGMKVSRIVTINENSSWSAPPIRVMASRMSMEADAAPPPPPVAAGELTLNAQVSLTVELEK